MPTKGNPRKCSFGVTLGKFLGFVVRRRGIEIDQATVRAIQDIWPTSEDSYQIFWSFPPF